MPLGGFYLNQLNVFVEFYKNLLPKVENVKKVSYCPYYEIPQFLRYNCTNNCPSNEPSHSTAQTVLNLCDFRSLDEPCFKKNTRGDLKAIQSSILPSNVVTLLKSDKPCTFVYHPKSEKIIYIFSDKNNSVAINSLRIVSSAGHINWFTKDLSIYGMYRFVGAFNWPTGINSSNIYLLAHQESSRNNLTLLEITDTAKFIFKPVVCLYTPVVNMPFRN